MDIDRIANLTFPPLHQQFDARDAMLYALSLGYGTDPLNEADLKFLYEDRLQAVPVSSIWTASPPVFSLT